MPHLALLLEACALSDTRVEPTHPTVPTQPTTPAEVREPPPPPAPVTDTFVYARPMVDVLLLVDNSSSMNGKNKTFAEAVEAAVTSWLALGIDFHVGVVDIDANEWHGTLEEYEGARWVDDTFADPVGAVSELVQDVQDLTSDEAGRRAAWLALQYAADGQPNAGFLREGAELAIVIHSDEDDGTEEPSHEEFVAFLQELRPEPGSLHFHAISYGTDYADIAEAVGGVTQDVGDTPYDPALEAATAMFHRTNVFALTRRPDPATLAVSVGGQPVDAFELDLIANGLDLAGAPLAEGDEVSVTYEPAGR